ncbi:MAG TPA: T9SS type A sorting domain-containing protein, partial [Bacteroidetes bacterium]|nr:T9SS type A sorting domain-containing protein [Bacteroidota bacterium]
DHQHKFTLTKLQPSAKYYYRVIVNRDTAKGSFRAAPGPNATQIKFFAYGDTRTYPAEHDKVAKKILSVYRDDPDFQTMIIASGDYTSNGAYESDWDGQFFNPSYKNIQALLATLPYQGCIGNHEGSGVLYKKYFPYPYVSRRYWSFDYGPAHFTVIDQYTSYSTGSAQYNWIEKDLASTKKLWKFLVFHEPGWSADGGHANNGSVQRYLQPLCEKYGVSIVFNGHNHYYSRAIVNGVVHITTGGGAPLYTPNKNYPHIVTVAKAHHFCKIEINDKLLTFAAVTTQGTVIDTFALNAPTHVDDSRGEVIPQKFKLYPAFPNPFNPGTNISFSMTNASEITLNIYNINGEAVRTLINGKMAPGFHRFSWNGINGSGKAVPSGIYIYRLKTKTYTGAGKMILVR